jgi:hypothetical protein
MRRGLREIKIPASPGLRDIKTSMKIHLLSIPRLRRRSDAQEYELSRVDNIHQNLALRAEYFREHIAQREAYREFQAEQMDAILKRLAKRAEYFQEHVTKRKAHEEFRLEQLAQRRERYVRHQQELEEFREEREAAERVWGEMNEILKEKRRKGLEMKR